ncbi:16S rRNA (adenine(1518)-N(6)/adenine(1519)-N(6))-dimethyltransferase RsmA [Tannockella kyphosi]|uniref:16S rRNA (adenine(1518)-N(6)/adenine(1519)-N(6))- dimethyltransferase RsmA n=1 Tax=Tannockella kyphosi TaxID=2899121 RepID=UPI002012FDE3|nr:16S rRNA (adenine(1518)-N(6)/adenine(1519)-N(6))-dimethyltransferase RsmA [Tannockella kyphosi]
MKDIATASTTTYILEKYKLQAMKKYGQNFLIDSNIVEKIVASGNVDKETCVIEIGPGIGALTQILARNAGQVISYEIDQRFQPVYEEFFIDQNIEIRFQDFLEEDIEKVVSELKQQYKRVCVVANLPYYITTKIIEKILTSSSNVDCMVVMIQKEVAEKFTSKYKSPLTIMMEDIGTCTYEFTVSKNVFIPSPRVDSAVMKIEVEKAIDLELYQVLQTSFVQRRKTIYNNLKTNYTNAEVILENSGIEKTKRSEELSLEDFKRITKNCI